jgi:hypothetical protein
MPRVRWYSAGLGSVARLQPATPHMIHRASTAKENPESPSVLSAPFLHLMAPYFLSISVVFSIGSASTVCPCAVIVIARNIEL